MARKLDPMIASVLKDYGFGADACWDCHGTWVVYHRVLEQIAAKAGITFNMPLVLEADGGSKSVALCVEGVMGERAEWSIGEAAPSNNKNSYPYAMAEKRAKDRVILKLIGLHGIAYSEDEADDFKDTRPAPQAAPQSPPEPSPMSAKAREYARDIQGCMDETELANFGKSRAKEIGTLSPDEQEHLRVAFQQRKAQVSEREAA